MDLTKVMISLAQTLSVDLISEYGQGAYNIEHINITLTKRQPNDI